MGGLPISTVNGFAVDPTDPKVMYVAMRDGLFRSEDAGEAWKRVDGPKNVAAVAVNPKQPAEMYTVGADGTLWTSSDGGGAWQARR